MVNRWVESEWTPCKLWVFDLPSSLTPALPVAYIPRAQRNPHKTRFFQLSLDGSTLATRSTDGTLKVWWG